MGKLCCVVSAFGWVAKKLEVVARKSLLWLFRQLPAWQLQLAKTRSDQGFEPHSTQIDSVESRGDMEDQQSESLDGLPEGVISSPLKSAEAATLFPPEDV
jgi:hypothetical protein